MNEALLKEKESELKGIIAKINSLNTQSTALNTQAVEVQGQIKLINRVIAETLKKKG